MQTVDMSDPLVCFKIMRYSGIITCDKYIMKNKYNWQEVQAYYDNGHSATDTAEKFGMRPQNLCQSNFFKSRPIAEQRKMAVETRTKNGNNKQTAETNQAEAI